MFEKRMYERSPIELAASYGIGEDPRPEKEARINNISLGGLCLTSDNKMSVGEDIQLAIEMDENNDLTVYAKVAWIKHNEENEKYTIGVQFVEKEGPDYERFLEFYDTQV